MFSSRDRHPEIVRDNGTSVFALLGAMGVGAALMYFLDPQNGRRRCARVRDQLVHGRKVALERAEAVVSDTANRTRGAIARVQSRLVGAEERVDDTVLVERVRAAMGHLIPDPHSIEVRARDGCVTLKGPARPHEIAELVACTERVRGVREVDNRLSVSNPS